MLFDQLHNAYIAIPIETAIPYSRYIESILKTDDATSSMFWRSQLSSPAYQHFPSTQSTSRIRTTIRDTSVIHNNRELPPIDMTIQLGWAIVLVNQTSSEDVIFGTTSCVQNTSLANGDSVIGPTESIVPFRVRFSDSQSIGSALQMIAEQSKAISLHGHFCRQNIVALGPDESDTIKFQNILIIQQQFESPAELSLVESYKGILTKTMINIGHAI